MSVEEYLPESHTISLRLSLEAHRLETAQVPVFCFLLSCDKLTLKRSHFQAVGY